MTGACLELVLGHDGLRLRQQLVPDAEAAVRAAHVGFAGAAAAQAGVEAQAHLAAGERGAVSLQLVQAARVQLHARADQLREEGRQLLRRQRHLRPKALSASAAERVSLAQQSRALLAAMPADMARCTS